MFNNADHSEQSETDFTLDINIQQLLIWCTEEEQICPCFSKKSRYLDFITITGKQGKPPGFKLFRF